MRDHELRAKLVTRANEFAKVLNTPAGKFFLETLEARYMNGDLMGKDDRELYLNLGAREVVLFLRFIVQQSEGTGTTNG